MTTTQHRPVALGEATVGELAQSVRGELLGPQAERYDEARSIWNAAHDRRPALIVRAAGVADVIKGVEFARSEGLPLAIRGGGHSIPGFSTVDGGLVLDLSAMKGVRVDPERSAWSPRPASLAGPRRRNGGVRARGHRRPGVDHRHRRLHPRRRDRLAGSHAAD